MSEQNTNGYYENGDNNNYYQNQDNNNYYNNQDSNQNNGQNNKKNNKGMIAVIIAVAAVVIIVGCTAAITFILGVNSGTTNISSTKETTAEKYADIGSTNSTDTSDSSSTSGSVVVTDVSKVVSNTMPSIVAITSTTVMQSNNYDSIYDYYFGGGDGNSKGSTYEQQAAGSGIIVDQTDSELLIVTNNHVIEDADSLKIQFDGMSSDKAVDGYIKGTDSTKDVAVVAVKLKDIPKATLNTIKKATLGDSDKVSVGEGVVAIGFALGYGQSVTTGIVSAKDREANIENKTMKLLQTDAAINPGNSGGALFNMKGEVIGINSAKYASDEVEGMGFAIPMSKAQSIIENLMNQETRDKLTSNYGFLNITGQDVSSEEAEKYNVPEGVYVSGTTDGGAAANAGIQRGDIITKLGNTTITTISQLKEELQYYKAGETVEVTIQRNSDGKGYQEQTLKVTLDNASQQQTNTTNQNNGGQSGSNGQYSIPGYGNNGGSNSLEQFFGYGN